MDRLIYTAMSGAKMLTQRQETISHNLANLNTNGFRAQLTAFRAVPVQGPGADTRVAAVETTVGSDFSPGQLVHTGNSLDVAINGRGFFAVQGADGNEAYTRDGGFTLSTDGELQTRGGLPVMGEGGPIQIPPNHQILVGRDGTISAVPLSEGRNATLQVGRLRLVNPPEEGLERSPDGLFRMKNGQQAEPDPSMTVAQGTIEGSNVNAVEALVGMITVARQFEQQMRLLQNAEQNAQRANQLFTLT